MWTDGDRVLNCTRAPLPSTPTKEHWATSFLGFIQDASPLKDEPTCACATPGAPCTILNRSSTFSDSCEGKLAYGTEPMRWTLAPTAQGANQTALVNFTNDILYPADMPEECYPADPSGRRARSYWWHQGYAMGYATDGCATPAPKADDFGVPGDEDCPLAELSAYASSRWRSRLALRGALPFARAAKHDARFGAS